MDHILYDLCRSRITWFFYGQLYRLCKLKNQIIEFIFKSEINLSERGPMKTPPTPVPKKVSDVNRDCCDALRDQRHLIVEGDIKLKSISDC